MTPLDAPLLLAPDALPAAERAAYLDGQRRIAQSVRAALRLIEAKHVEHAATVLRAALEAADAA